MKAILILVLILFKIVRSSFPQLKIEIDLEIKDVNNDPSVLLFSHRMWENPEKNVFEFWSLNLQDIKGSKEMLLETLQSQILLEKNLFEAETELLLAEYTRLVLSTSSNHHSQSDHENENENSNKFTILIKAIQPGTDNVFRDCRFTFDPNDLSQNRELFLARCDLFCSYFSLYKFDKHCRERIFTESVRISQQYHPFLNPKILALESYVSSLMIRKAFHFSWQQLQHGGLDIAEFQSPYRVVDVNAFLSLVKSDAEDSRRGSQQEQRNTQQQQQRSVDVVGGDDGVDIDVNSASQTQLLLDKAVGAMIDKILLHRSQSYIDTLPSDCDCKDSSGGRGRGRDRDKGRGRQRDASTISPLPLSLPLHHAFDWIDLSLCLQIMTNVGIHPSRLESFSYPSPHISSLYGGFSDEDSDTMVCTGSLFVSKTVAVTAVAADKRYDASMSMSMWRAVFWKKPFEHQHVPFLILSLPSTTTPTTIPSHIPSHTPSTTTLTTPTLTVDTGLAENAGEVNVNKNNMRITKRNNAITNPSQPHRKSVNNSISNSYSNSNIKNKNKRKSERKSEMKLLFVSVFDVFACTNIAHAIDSVETIFSVLAAAITATSGVRKL